jgi:hypothetical protein
VFHTGQKVVCVEAPRKRSLLWTQYPVEGAIYTIRKCWMGDRDMVVLLNELKNPIGPKGERTFWAHRFRPVQERSTEAGVAMLRKLLNTKQRKLVS